jgi:1,4-alpha-glucan branching enzyme
MARPSSLRLALGLLAGLAVTQAAPAQITIFSDSFNTTTWNSAWTRSGTNNWRIGFSSSSSYRQGTSGFGVIMDDSTAGGYSTNRLDLTLNLSAWNNVTVQFKFRNVADELQPANEGVFFSTDNGATWHKTAWNFPAQSTTWHTVTINLSQEASSRGLMLTNQTKIRWQQYDDYALTSDGVALDDVVVRGTPAGPSSRPGMGATPYINGTTFRVWAPNASAVNVAGEFNNWSDSMTALFSEGNGHWSRDVDGALINDQYQYVITHNGTKLWRNDARAQDVTNSVGNSVVADLAYTWQSNFTMPPWNELVIYEMHIGTLNDSPGGGPGTFQSAIGRLDHIAGLGVNALKVMPVAEFAGDFSWGYNPAHPFAPESAYGSPRDMKQFVDAAHARGMAVILDVVYNHWGPSDLSLWNYDGPSLGNGGIYFFTDWRRVTPWGDTRPDYGRGEVRTYIRDNALYWLNEYRIDGLRWDSTVNIRTQNNGSGGDIPEGWSLMQWVNNEIDAAAPWKISIAEDLQNNEWITRPTGAGGAGFDSQWDARFVHPIRAAIITSSDSNRNMYAVRDAITASYNGSHTQRVIYTESHDEVNNGHSRVPEEIWPGNAGSWASKKRSTLGAGIVFTSPGIPMIFQGQEILEDGYWHDSDPIDWNKLNTYGGIRDMYRDMIRLRRNWYNNTRGLRANNVNVHHINNTNKVIGYHRWENGGPGDDVIIVANFSNQGFSSYNLGFPRAGTWYVRFNSDWNGYSSDFGNWNSYNTTANPGAKDGMGFNGNVGIGPYSLIILSQ